jgi:non-ribosomal peptide synthase protein (TIGR01720 family)
VLLDLSHAPGPDTAIKAIKEQLRAVPQGGLGYGVLRYLSPGPAAAQLAALPQAEVIFNYLGQLDQVLGAETIFRPADEPAGPSVSPAGARSHALEISGQISEGQLRFTWTYSAERYRAATIERLAQDFRAALQGLIAHCTAPEAGGYTPSDLPGARLSQGQLDAFIGKITRQGQRKAV